MTSPYFEQQRQAMEAESPNVACGWALLELARRLDDARKKPAEQENIRQTVRLNWRVWTILQAELSNPDFSDSKEIRENMLSLSNFIDKRSLDIIGTKGDVEANRLDVLVNINHNIGNGLLGNIVNEDGKTLHTKEPDMMQAVKEVDLPRKKEAETDMKV